jgi:hypothetical protein
MLYYALTNKQCGATTMYALTTPEQITKYKLLTLKSALGLEIKGLKGRGKSANTLACQLLGLPKGTKKTVTFAYLEHAIQSL